MDITQTIKDSLDAISLILVFVFVLFGVRYPQIVHDLEEKIPVAERADERVTHRRSLYRTLWYKDVPLIIVNGVLLYLLLPSFVMVVQGSRIAAWHFEFLRTSFVVVVLFVATFLLWSIVLGVRLVKRISESSRLPQSGG